MLVPKPIATGHCSIHFLLFLRYTESWTERPFVDAVIQIDALVEASLNVQFVGAENVLRVS